MAIVRTSDGAIVRTSDGDIVRTSPFESSVEIECSITIEAPALIPSAGVQQWRLHQFNIKARIEQSA